MSIEACRGGEPSRTGCVHRRADIIATAQAEFFARGYGATSMSVIAARIGGSKTTLWTYFPSKYALFAAVVADLVGRFAQSVEDPLAHDLALAEALELFAHNMMAIVETPEIIALHRVVIAEAGRFPELGALVFEYGPGRGQAKLARYLKQAMASGQIRAGDPLVAASQFIALCQCGGFQDRLWGMPAGDELARRNSDMADAMMMWLAAWRGDEVRDTMQDDNNAG